MSCACLGTPTIVVPPTCPTGENCLKMATIIVACKDAVGPCGAQGTVNVIDSGIEDKPYSPLYRYNGFKVGEIYIHNEDEFIVMSIDGRDIYMESLKLINRENLLNKLL